jgi:hypothetical protein
MKNCRAHSVGSLPWLWCMARFGRLKPTMTLWEPETGTLFFWQRGIALAFASTDANNHERPRQSLTYACTTGKSQGADNQILCRRQFIEAVRTGPEQDRPRRRPSAHKSLWPRSPSAQKKAVGTGSAWPSIHDGRWHRGLHHDGEVMLWYFPS